MRRQESQQSLSRYGVAIRHQVYGGYRDGALSEQHSKLARHITRLLLHYQATEIITSGPDGYDGHPDHIAVHLAAVEAVGAAAKAGRQVLLFALNSRHTGKTAFRGDPTLKLAALACHTSQIVTPDLTRWGNTDLYTPLIVHAETYDTYTAADLPRSLV